MDDADGRHHVRRMKLILDTLLSRNLCVAKKLETYIPRKKDFRIACQIILIKFIGSDNKVILFSSMLKSA